MGVSVQSLRSCSVLVRVSRCAPVLYWRGSVAALLLCVGEWQSVAALLFCIANYRLQSPATITAPKSLRWRFQ